MELPGSIYLYALATVSITFVGFSAILLIFRQAIGGTMTRYDTYFMLSFIKSGFIVTAGSLLPPVLALYGWSPSTVWRVSSIIMAIAVFMFVVTLPARRRAASRQRVPMYVLILLFVQVLIASYLLINGISGPIEPRAAPYAAAITGLLFTYGIAYLRALATVLGESERSK